MSFYPTTPEEILETAIRRHADARSGERIYTAPVETPPTPMEALDTFAEVTTIERKNGKKRRVTVAEVSRTYLGLPIEDRHREVSMKDICELVCEHFCVSYSEFISKRRLGNLIRCRWVAMRLCQELTSKTHMEMARYMHRDHTTIGHGLDKVEDILTKVSPRKSRAYTKLKDSLDLLRARITAKFGITDKGWPDSE